MKRHRSLTRGCLPLAIGLVLAAAGAEAATITVNSSDDSSTSTFCNLRKAITSLNNGVILPACNGVLTGTIGTDDTVAFTGTLANSTITLNQGTLDVTAPMTIAGSGQTINAAGASRVLTTNATVTISAVTMTGGAGANSGVVSGGAIGAYGASNVLTLNNVTLTGNSAQRGSAIFAYNASAVINRSTITGNHATGAHGGAVLATKNQLTLTDSTISNNTANCDGNYCSAGLYTAGSSALIVGSTISGNTATNSGAATLAYVSGGAYFYVSNATLINTTISGNSASANNFAAGGIMHCNCGGSGHTLVLTNSTVSGNSVTAGASAAYVSGGILEGAYNGGTLTVANTILAGNTATIGSAAAINKDQSTFDGTVTFSNSLLGTALSAAYSTGNNVFSDTPGLAPLKNNGGPTRTMALIAGSPAIDAGSNAAAVDAASQTLTTDQTGAVRIFNTTVDIGAFEFPGDTIFIDGFET